MAMLLASPLFFLLSGQAVSQAQAQTKNYSLDRVDVDITVNEDSSMNVSEKITYTFNDEMNGMFREITLEDKEDLERCRSNPALQCGGFNYINIDRVLVNDKEVKEGRYEIIEKSTYTEDRLRVQYKFDGAPVRLNNKTYTFQIDYTVLGGIGFFDDYDFFYWNAIFEDRDKPVKVGTVKIHYPGDVDTSDETNMTVYSELGLDYTYENDRKGNVSYEAKDIPTYYDFTIAQKVKKGLITSPATLKVSLDPVDQTIVWKDFEIEATSGLDVEGVPAGEDTELEFKKSGYYSKSTKVDLLPGETTAIEVKLEPTLFTRVVAFLIIFGNLCFCGFALLAPGLIWARWYLKGRDAYDPKAVIPEFEPPNGIAPYLLGSLKDEVVDQKDISATIIDLAYRGHIKIVELEKKFLGKQDYELKKLDNAKDELDDIEQSVMNMLFTGSKDTVKLSSLKYKAYTKMDNIKKDIYKDMVSAGYFSKSPDSTRKTWLGVGIAVLVGGIGVSIAMSMVGVVTGFCTVLTLGIGLMVASRFMPAKTQLGSETLRHIRGFKMYLETAEKYTLQNLTPEMFEKYLSYAVVFGVEEKWAETFKDIYKGAPDWYESQNGTFNTILFANHLNSFSTSAGSNITTRPSSSSSSSGGGWSGGGGFSGGFSGGGGGGGGGGAW